MLLSPIMVVSKKNKKFRIYVDFKKLNIVRKNDPYPLLYIGELLNSNVRHDAYFFLNEYFRYHQISITPKGICKITFITYWGAFTWVVMLFGVKEGPLTY
jgi:hypothetical protein